jgi:hypothetical protein
MVVSLVVTLGVMKAVLMVDSTGCSLVASKAWMMADWKVVLTAVPLAVD